MKAKITKTVFDLIFAEAMKCNRVSPSGSTEWEGIKPQLVIRDFEEIDDDHHNLNSTNIDKRFEIDEQIEAWRYFNTLSRCRVMDISGQIFIDEY